MVLPFLPYTLSFPGIALNRFHLYVKSENQV